MVSKEYYTFGNYHKRVCRRNKGGGTRTRVGWKLLTYGCGYLLRREAGPLLDYALRYVLTCSTNRMGTSVHGQRTGPGVNVDGHTTSHQHNDAVADWHTVIGAPSTNVRSPVELLLNHRFPMMIDLSINRSMDWAHRSRYPVLTVSAR